MTTIIWNHWYFTWCLSWIGWPVGFCWAILISAVGVHKTNPQKDMGASPDALCLFWGNLVWLGLLITWLHFECPFVGEVGFCCLFCTVFCFVPLGPSFPLSISDCGSSALVNTLNHTDGSMRLNIRIWHALLHCCRDLDWSTATAATVCCWDDSRDENVSGVTTH